MRRVLKLSSLFAILLVAAGCEGDPILPQETPQISEGEAGLVAVALDQVQKAALDFIAADGATFNHSPSFAAMTAGTTTEVFDRTEACPVSGTVQAQGNATRTRDAVTQRTTLLEANGTAKLGACAIKIRENVTFTTTGDVAFGARLEQSADGTTGTQTGSITGEFSWTKSTGESGVSGDCSIKLSSTYDKATDTRTVKGTLCGHTVERTIVGGQL